MSFTHIQSCENNPPLRQYHLSCEYIEMIRLYFVYFLIKYDSLYPTTIKTVDIKFSTHDTFLK